MPEVIEKRPDGTAFIVVSFDLRVLDKMAAVSLEEVPDPFDRIIAALR